MKPPNPFREWLGTILGMVRKDSGNRSVPFSIPQKGFGKRHRHFPSIHRNHIKKRIQLFANPLSAQQRIDTSDTSTTIHTSAQKLTRKARFMSAVVRQRSVSPM